DPVSILFVASHYPPCSGGAERHTQQLSQSLFHRGNRARVLTIRYPGIAIANEAGQAPVWRFPTPVRAPWCDLAFSLWVLAALVLLRPRYRVAQWVMTGLQALMGIPMAAALGMKNVVVLAGCVEAERLRGSVRGRWMLTLMQRNVERIVVQNSAMETELLSLGFGRDRLVCLPCGVDPDLFRPARPGDCARLRALWNVPQASLLVVYTGRLVHGKGLPELIEAFAVLHSHLPGTMLILVGDGPLAASLQMQIREAGLGSAVRFTGQVPPSGVSEILRLADVFVLPSESEGSPCALV